VEKAFRSTVEVLEAQGAEIVPCSLPHMPFANAAYYILATAEASSNLGRFDGIRYGTRKGGGCSGDEVSVTRTAGFGPEVKRRILLGTFVLSSGYAERFYRKALQARSLICADFRQAFASGLDAILCPTLPVPPFPLGERVEDPLAMYRVDVFTVAVNLAGLPGISVPSGTSAEGLPVGLQVIGDRFDEAMVLRIARGMEKTRGTVAGI
jgi:aspartyl-tRNA(Asn)/glutamyl-tRNA(Gln) amidotransferase subunit A